MVTPQRDLLARGIDDILEIPGLEVDSRNYFRDVYDHAIRISDQIDSYRDLLAGTRDAYLSVVSNRLNQITKQLTVVATIFLPLSFVVGFFGQNFKWLVVNIDIAGGLLRARDRQPRALGDRAAGLVPARLLHLSRFARNRVQGVQDT